MFLCDTFKGRCFNDIMRIDKPDYHTIGLVPVADQEVWCTQEISKLSAAFGGSTFSPHVTILGRIIENESKLVERVGVLASVIRAMSVRVLGVQSEKSWNRTLYLDFELIDALRQAHTEAARLFDRQPSPDFHPHLSLAYGTFSVEQQQAMQRVIVAAPTVIHLNRLALFRNFGQPNEWVRIGEWSLLPDHAT
jgi:2'-5' RNA ligase